VLGLVNLVLLPFSWLLSLLRGSSSADARTEPTPFQLPAQASQTLTFPAWELIKSILFWIFFLGVVIFAFLYYFRHNSNLQVKVNHLNLVIWVKNIYRMIRKWLSGARNVVLTTIIHPIGRILSRYSAGSILRPRQFLNFKLLDPRRQLIFFYLQLLEEAGKRGTKRKDFQTPNQFARIISQSYHETDDDINTMTELFIEARYTRHEITQKHTSKAQALWRKVIKAIKRHH
jgi:hypothetical protein